MDDRFGPRPLARWYMAAAVAALLFMLLGCAMLLLDVTASRADMTLDQRVVDDARPLWVVAGNAVAVVLGVIGGVLLMLRRRLAEWLLLASFVAVLVWMAGLLLVPRLRDVLSTNDIAVALVVTLITWTIYAFARHSRQRGWLR